jgi:hypothetical protein
MPGPGQSTQAPGMPFARSAAYTSAGTSPQSATLTLPEYGIYLAHVHGAFNNNNNLAIVTASIIWYKFDAAGGSADTVAKTNLHGTPGYSSGPGSPTINSLTVGDPTSAGVVTIGVGWSDTATTHTAWVSWTLHKLASALDLAANGSSF